MQSSSNVSPESDPTVPPGFVLAAAGSGFASRNATFYGQWANEHLLLGFRVEEQHTNLGGVLHGGMLATFADTLLPYAAMYQALGGRRFLPTISLQIDYLAPAAIGAWVQGSADVLRMTRNMLFMQAIIAADETPIARVSGIFKLGAIKAQLEGDFLNIKR